jgi:uncharacterized protein (TIGR02145 family)
MIAPCLNQNSQNFTNKMENKTMKKQLAKLALTAAFGLAITFTFTACDEKKKQEGATTPTEPATATETQQPSQEVAVEVTEVIIFTDTRDKKTYKTVKLGEQVWFAENLNFEAKGSKCYDDKPDNCKKYGRLYNWMTAFEACPSGWHLPSQEEWRTLTDFFGGWSVAGKKIKAKSGWNKNGNGTDDFGFAALPGGHHDGTFTNVGNFGYWWTASEGDGSAELTTAVYFVMYMSDDNEKFGDNLYDDGDLNSVRCIKD